MAVTTGQEEARYRRPDLEAPSPHRVRRVVVNLPLGAAANALVTRAETDNVLTCCCCLSLSYRDGDGDGLERGAVAEIIYGVVWDSRHRAAPRRLELEEPRTSEGCLFILNTMDSLHSHLRPSLRVSHRAQLQSRGPVIWYLGPSLRVLRFACVSASDELKAGGWPIVQGFIWGCPHPFTVSCGAARYSSRTLPLHAKWDCGMHNVYLNRCALAVHSSTLSRTTP
jgi:hypothetical protein